MPSLDQTIRSALQKAALAVPGMPQPPQIAFENIKFESTIGTPWGRLAVVPTSSRPIATGLETKRHDGLLLIDLFQPPDTGTGAIEALGNALRDGLQAGTHLVLNGVTVVVDYVERARAMDQKPDWLMCSVTVKWHCFSSMN